MKKILFFTICALVLILLASCEEPTQVPENSPTLLLAKDYIAPPNCGEGSQFKPTNLSPDGGVSVNADSIDLSWYFDGCPFYSFLVQVSESPTLNFMGSEVFDDVPDTETSYTLDLTGFDHCTTYFWKVSAVGSRRYESDLASFRIDDGTCEQPHTCQYGISTPSLVSPVSGDLGDTFGPNPQLVWNSFDTCLPENYHYEVSQTPDFEQIVFEGDTLAEIVTPAQPYLSEDCSVYFWRVVTELNGKSWPSATAQFMTDFGNGCESSLCTADQLAAPVLIQPAQSSVITTMYIYFMWNFENNDCQPGYYVLELDDDPAFQSPTMLDSGKEQFSFFDDDAWFSYYMSNCHVYYWRVTAFTEDGLAFAQSEINSFLYNTGHTICASAGNMGNAPAEALDDFNLGCVSNSQMWALYNFKGPVCGDFEVHIGNRVWPCEWVQGTIGQLFCYGALPGQQAALPVDLFMVGSQVPILSREATTPQCSGGASGCQPPAEGCPPIVGHFPDGTPYTTATHWDALQCKCVP